MSDIYLTDNGFPIKSPYELQLTKVKRRLVSTPEGMKKEKRYFHQDVSRLFVELMKHPTLEDNLEFGVNVMFLAAGPLGYPFFRAPRKDFGGFTLYEFIQDTHRYISGEKRVISVQDWLGLVLASRNTVRGMRINVNSKLNHIRGTYIFDADLHREYLMASVPPPSTIPLINWAASCHGIRDILTCLFALYGRYDLYKQDPEELKHVFSK